jgi:hypothetical protein
LNLLYLEPLNKNRPPHQLNKVTTDIEQSSLLQVFQIFFLFVKGEKISNHGKRVVMRLEIFGERIDKSEVVLNRTKKNSLVLQRTAVASVMIVNTLIFHLK